MYFISAHFSVHLFTQPHQDLAVASAHWNQVMIICPEFWIFFAYERRRMILLMNFLKNWPITSSQPPAHIEYFCPKSHVHTCQFIYEDAHLLSRMPIVCSAMSSCLQVPLKSILFFISSAAPTEIQVLRDDWSPSCLWLGSLVNLFWVA